MHKELSNQMVAASSTPIGSREFWRHLWALPVPNVENNFLWRACQNILPTKDILHKRRIFLDLLCPVYGLEVETRFHILWQCPSTMDAWTMGVAKFQKCSFAGHDFMQLLEYFFDKCDLEKLKIFAGMSRHLWLRQNDLIHGNHFTHPKMLAVQTTQAIMEFSLAHAHDESHIPTQVPQATH